MTPLAGVRIAMASLPGNPLGVVATPDGRWAFVSLNNTIAVLDATEFPPRVTRQITVQGQPASLTLTGDAAHLLIASGGGAIVIDTARAESGEPDAVLGELQSPESGAIEVAITPGDRFAVITMESSGVAAVFDLAAALADGFASSHLIGTVPLGDFPVRMAFSPDGRWLYALSEARRGTGGGQAPVVGTLSVIDVARVGTQPESSVVSTVAAGCSPVGVAVSADGSTTWVTSRESDSVLGFSAALLRTDPAHAAGAVVPVGAAPVGLALVDHDRRMIVADSNRFGEPGASADLAVVDVQAALAGQPALVGRLPSGRFPREVTVVPGSSTLLVTNYDSEQLEAVDLSTLPA